MDSEVQSNTEESLHYFIRREYDLFWTPPFILPRSAYRPVAVHGRLMNTCFIYITIGIHVFIIMCFIRLWTEVPLIRHTKWYFDWNFGHKEFSISVKAVIIYSWSSTSYKIYKHKLFHRLIVIFTHLNCFAKNTKNKNTKKEKCLSINKWSRKNHHETNVNLFSFKTRTNRSINQSINQSIYWNIILYLSI